MSERRFKHLKSYCKCRYLRCVINNDYGQRNNRYRKDFFDNNHPVLSGKYYFCAYCGKPVSKKEVTVDHLIPVHKTETSLKMQRKLKRMGYRSVNDPKNLVPACRRCNTKKGTKTGLWLIRGRIGRIQILWYPVWAIRIAVSLAVIYCVHRLLVSIGFFDAIICLL